MSRIKKGHCSFFFREEVHYSYFKDNEIIKTEDHFINKKRIGGIKMFKIFSAMPHVMFGVWGIIMAVWAIVELLNISEKNQKRLGNVTLLSSIFIWASYIAGGWWYWVYYGAKEIGDKYVIKGGPWPWAHSFVMEVKEHVFFLLILLSMLLVVIVKNNNLLENKNIKKLAITVAVIVVVLGFGMEAFGSIITKGVKAGLIGF